MIFKVAIFFKKQLLADVHLRRWRQSGRDILSCITNVYVAFWKFILHKSLDWCIIFILHTHDGCWCKGGNKKVRVRFQAIYVCTEAKDGKHAIWPVIYCFPCNVQCNAMGIPNVYSSTVLVLYVPETWYCLICTWHN